MIPLLAYGTAGLTFWIGYVLGKRAGSRPNAERYNRGWLDGYEIGKRLCKPDTPADEPVPPMVNTTTSASPAAVKLKRQPAKITAKRKATK